jgi:hypothetical protein
MRHVATAALFLSLIQSNANAELAAPPKVAADDVNSAAAATLVREADTPRVIGETAQYTGVTVAVYLTPYQGPSDGRWDAGNAIRPPPRKGVE